MKMNKIIAHVSTSHNKPIYALLHVGGFGFCLDKSIAYFHVKPSLHFMRHLS
jgi:hypothetical protein